MNSWSTSRWKLARLLAVLHFVLLIVFRILLDQDDFNNWDLISFLNAVSAPDLWSLLALPEVHLRNPFSFPIYNTGAESVLSAVIHRAVASFSLYWSNAVVVLVYDALFVWASYRLQQLVFRKEESRWAVWLLLAMSPVILTFSSTSAFDMQGFATVVVALLGCELVLHSRNLFGLSLLLLAFLCISQAYGITYFVPVFAGAWLVARSAALWADGLATPKDLLRSLAIASVSLLFLTAAVQIASDGDYSNLFVTTLHPEQGLWERLTNKTSRLVQAWAGYRIGAPGAELGFAPWFLIVEGAVFGTLLLAGSRRPPGAEHGSALRRLVPAASWMLLVALGYVPSLMGGLVKSQRCFFGDYFAAMALAQGVGRISLHPSRWRFLRVQFLAVLLISDAYYVYAVSAVDHTRFHMNVFDYDTADGYARHDLTRMIREMRSQADSGALVVIDYPRGYSENTTDPSVFHARFLRHFGDPGREANVVFSCRYCSVRYGCPSFAVRGQKCAASCCYSPPRQRLLRAISEDRTLYFWIYGRNWQDRLLRLIDGAKDRLVIHEPCGDSTPGRWTCLKATRREE